jgi:antitoxin (DNA-binding transcriptional repressor) of toxin-antitoxin stability system
MAKFANMTTPLPQITSAELRDQIRTVIDACVRGESIVITRWGSPVAIIAPYGYPLPAECVSAPGDNGAPSLGLSDQYSAHAIKGVAV